MIGRELQNQVSNLLFDTLLSIWVKSGVRVNAVAAGPLATTAAKNIPGFADMDDEWNQRAPLGWDSKNAIPVAKVVNFLLSEFSEAVSGEIIHADGGAHSVGGTMLPK